MIAALSDSPDLPRRSSERKRRSPVSNSAYALDRSRPRDTYPGDSKTKLYVGGLTSRIEKRDLEDIFERCGPLVSVKIKNGGFAFVEYEDARDAEDAVRKLCDYELQESRLLVEFSRSKHGGGGGCFLCGASGHWARECPDSRSKGMDVRSGLCFRCGQPGHLARHCLGPNYCDDPYYGGASSRGRSRSPHGRRCRTPSPFGRGGYASSHGDSYDGVQGGGYDRRKSFVYNEYCGVYGDRCAQMSFAERSLSSI